MLNFTKVSAGILIATALLLGIYAWALGRQPPNSVKTVPAMKRAFAVVVAAKRLPAGRPIAADALRIEKLSAFPSGAFAEPMLVAKRIPLADIEPDTPVFEGQLSSGFAERVQPGERAVAVRVDEAGAVGELVRPGNVVDVFLTLKRDGAGMGAQAEIARSQAKLLLSGVRVLAFGDAPPAGGGPNTHAVHARTVVLAVPKGDVDRLALADSAGHLLLALRSPHDSDGVERTSSAVLARVGGSAAHALRPSTVADAGVSLAALSGSDSRAEAMPSARAQMRHTTIPAAAQVEVVRAGHIDAPGS